MENPTFKLQGIIKSKESSEDFEGPLILILHLLSKNKVEIRDIQISLILDQYLKYLDEMKQMDLEIASEFITMASHLTYIKAKTLLAGEQEEVSELEALQNSLEELRRRESYKQMKDAALNLSERAQSGFRYFVKTPEALPKDGLYRYSHEVKELRDVLIMLLEKEGERAAAPANMVIPGRLIYPVGEKTEDLLILLRESGIVKVRALFAACKGRSELVATFMAVLELCKSGNILLYEEDGEFIAQNIYTTEEA